MDTSSKVRRLLPHRSVAADSRSNLGSPDGLDRDIKHTVSETPSFYLLRGIGHLHILLLIIIVQKYIGIFKQR